MITDRFLFPIFGIFFLFVFQKEDMCELAENTFIKDMATFSKTECKKLQRLMNSGN